MLLKLLRFIASKLIGNLPIEKREKAWERFIEFVAAITPDTVEIKP